MKKQLYFLYTLLFLFVAVIGYAGYSILTLDTEPEIPEEFVQYKEIQDEVTINDEEPDNRVYLDFNLEELLSINPDFETWLMIPDTDISFPVVRTTDNYYYLKHDFSKKSSSFGCLYFDTTGTSDSVNRVIHGHNMGNNRKEMFSTLVEFQEQEYAETHKYAYLSSDPEIAADTYELYAVVNFNLAKNPGFDYAQPNFSSDEERSEFISYLKSRSIYTTDFDPDGELLILSTCNRQYGGYNRLLLCFGKVDASAVSSHSEKN